MSRFKNDDERMNYVLARLKRFGGKAKYGQLTRTSIPSGEIHLGLDHLIDKGLVKENRTKAGGHLFEIITPPTELD